jgi:hypothetical protein
VLWRRCCSVRRSDRKFRAASAASKAEIEFIAALALFGLPQACSSM